MGGLLAHVQLLALPGGDVMREDDRLFASCTLGRCLWQAGRIEEFSKMLSDSGLTRRLTKAQLETVARKAGVR